MTQRQPSLVVEMEHPIATASREMLGRWSVPPSWAGTWMVLPVGPLSKLQSGDLFFREEPFQGVNGEIDSPAWFFRLQSQLESQPIQIQHLMPPASQLCQRGPGPKDEFAPRIIQRIGSNGPETCFSISNNNEGN